MDCCNPGSNEPEQKKDKTQPSKSIKTEVGATKTSVIWGMVFILIAGTAFGYFIKPSTPSEDHLEMIKQKTTEEQREDWIAIADNIRGKLAIQSESEYDCCLKAPCWYCIQKTPGHGEGAKCTCRQDILNGEHPCGECIGEILEGHGLTELTPYYAKAIAHKVGEEHEGHLQEIIDDMYPQVIT